jgi:hypothetical protein
VGLGTGRPKQLGRVLHEGLVGLQQGFAIVSS